MSYYPYSSEEEPDHTIFVVSQDIDGRYLVQENHGSVGGEFASRNDAVRFARDESQTVPGAIVFIMPPLIGPHVHVQ